MSTADLLKKAGFDEEVWEEAIGQHIPTGFPKPVKRYRISYEAVNLSVEESYFWLLNYISVDIGFHKLYKTIDAFAASENSAFFGVTQQRIGLQQDKVSQFLATVGKMIKEIFQLVRELRIIDERLGYYYESYGIDKNENPIRGGSKESAEITLKGIWIDMVEGGAKSPSSVFGMSREVQFTSLPDLFFSTHPKNAEDVDSFVEKERGAFNKSVRNVLKRKLFTYLRWKETTFKELKVRRSFTLKYLKQHYTIIKMYMTWVKPYLKHIRRLTLDEEKVLRPDLVSAFEGSMIEVEFLAAKNPHGKYHPCILSHFLFRTRPSMSFQQEGYQRGPIHLGKLNMDFRGYIWTEEQINRFIKMRDEEDLELIKSISGSLAEAIDAMGDDLKNYLDEAEGQKKAGEKQKAKKQGFIESFKAEFLGPSEKKEKAITKPKVNPAAEAAKKKSAEKELRGELFLLFKNYKKAHDMVMW